MTDNDTRPWDERSDAYNSGPESPGLEGCLRDDTIRALEECDRQRERESADLQRRWRKGRSR